MLKKVKRVVNNDNGMALLITISIIVVLVGVTTSFALKARYSYFSSTTFLDGSQLDVMTLSGVNIGMTILEVDGVENEMDSLLDVWAIDKQPSLAGLFNRGELELQIADETALLQLNRLVSNGEEGAADIALVLRRTLKNLLLSEVIGIADETAADEIIDSITDWIDTDDEESEYGGEAPYYENLEEPYKCKNGPIEDVKELLRIKGISSEIFYGENESRGLKDFVTAFDGDGKININTVDPVLLQALQPSVTEEMKMSFDIFRTDEDHVEKLRESNWYKNVDYWPADISLPEEILTVSSTCFRLTAIGRFNELSRTRQVYVARSGKIVTVLNMRLE